MVKCYLYNKLLVIFTFGLLLLLPLVTGLALFVVVGIPTTTDIRIIAGIVYLFIGVMSLAILTWIFTVLKTRIHIDANGITSMSPFRKTAIAWKDISNIERKYIYSGSFPTGGPPKDLEIKTNDNKKLKIFYFITNCETQDLEEGIKDIESEIKKHTNIEF